MEAPARAVEAFASILPLGLFELGADGRVEWANERWYELVGRTRDADGPQWLDTVHALDRSAAAVAAARRAGLGQAFRRPVSRPFRVRFAGVSTWADSWPPATVPPPGEHVPPAEQRGGG